MNTEATTQGKEATKKRQRREHKTEVKIHSEAQAAPQKKGNRGRRFPEKRSSKLAKKIHHSLEDQTKD